MPVLRVYADDKLVDQFEMTTDRILIGRSPDNDLVLNNRGVSKHHAVIEKQKSSYVLIDTDSANGTFVDKQRVTRQKLEYWNEIRIADYALKFMATQRQELETVEEQSEETVASEKTTVMDAAKVAELIASKQKVVKPLLLPVAVNPTLAARYEIAQSEIILGKDKQCDIPVGGFWSPKHAARLTWSNDEVFVENLSWRKITLNSQKLTQKTRLYDGDRLIINGVQMEFRHVPSKMS